MSPLAITDHAPWKDEAACGVDPDPDAWYADAPERGNGGARGRARVAHAKAVCATCPVRLQCLEWAMDHDEKWGIWGGLTADERQALRERNAA